MEVEGYFLEFNISNSDMLSNLTFEVETPIDTGEVNLTQYQLEIIEKENGIYLAIQNNHFHIKNGTVQMHIAIDPILLNEEIVYKLTGVDKQGINTNQAEFSQIQ
nr:hypothetical protein [uncultured Draconibacterium sp.]